MRQSKAYLLFRESIQEIFTFAVIVTASVPVLRQNIKLCKKGAISRLPDTDYFQPSVLYSITQSTIEKLRDSGVAEPMLVDLEKLLGISLSSNDFKRNVSNIIGEELYKTHRNLLKRQTLDYVDNLDESSKGYQSSLATYLYFSAFSYFEAYVADLAKEVANQFHRIDTENYNKLHPLNEVLNGYRNKLIKPFDSRKKDRYQKFSKTLREANYIPPSELLFSSILGLFDEKVGEMKANDIPVFLKKMFFFEIPDQDNQMFHTIRSNRNSIGHGDKAFVPTLSDVMEVNKLFKKLSAEIDRHVVFHFFTLDNYTKPS